MTVKDVVRNLPWIGWVAGDGPEGEGWVAGRPGDVPNPRGWVGPAPEMEAPDVKMPEDMPKDGPEQE